MAWTTRRSGMAAGGYNNSVTFDPTLEGHIICCGDTFGMNETFDGGDTWWPANLGLITTPPAFGGVTFDPLTGDAFTVQGSGFVSSTRVYTGQVETNAEGSFTRWDLGSSAPSGTTFANDNLSYLPGSDPRPRAVGTMIGVQTISATRYLYIVTHDGGAYRSNNDFNGNSVNIADEGLLGSRLHGLAMDPTDNTRMLVARWDYGTGGNGALLLDTIRTAGTNGAGVTELTAAPDTVLEFCVIGNNVYAACGWYGVYRVTGANWGTWTQIDNGLPAATPNVAGEPYVSGITGYNNGVDDVLFITYVKPAVGSGGMYKSVFRVVGAQTGDPAWSNLTAVSANVSNLVRGSGESWWVLSSFASFALGKSTGDAENCAIDPFDNDHLHTVGRAGGWSSFNANAAAGSVLFRPSVYGQVGTTPRSLLTDPGRANHVYQMNTDHGVLGSANDMQPGTVKKIKPAGASNQGTWGDVGPDGKLYVCTGIRDNYGTTAAPANGEIYRYDGDPIDNVATSLNLKGFTGTTQNKPAGIAVTGTSGTPIVIAGVQGKGICRKVGSGAWATEVNNTQFSVSPHHTDLYPTAKDINGNAVFIIDPDEGVFRTLDQGANWPNNTGAQGVWWTGTSFISIGTDPDVSGRIYGCKSNGIYRVNSSTTQSTNPNSTETRITPTSGPLTNLAGMAIDRDRGYLYAFTNPSATQDAEAYECQNPGAGSPVFNLISGKAFAAAGYSINWVAVDNPGGQVFVMPSGVFILEETGVPGGGGAVGTLLGGTRFLAVR